MNKGPVLTVVNAGGHLTQALCVMKVIEEFHLVTSIPIDAELGAESLTVIKGSQFNPFVHLINVFKAYQIIRRIRPVAIFSTGGPICLPFAFVAKMIGLKFIYLDTLSRVVEPSNTAKLLYHLNLADEMYCQWEGITKKYPKIKYYGKTFNICNHRNLSL